jgi:hypothetical protein
LAFLNKSKDAKMAFFAWVYLQNPLSKIDLKLSSLF